MSRATRLGEALAARGVRWPAPLDWQGSVGSTNDVAKAWARADAKEWSVVLADSQTGGRGREGRAWISPAGGVYLSVVLRPRFAGVALLPLAAGVAVSDVARENGVEAELKWPNDVLVHGRKLAGVLTESSSSAAGMDWAVVGIGVNVATDRASLGAALGETATSLRLEAEAVPLVEEVAAGVLARLRVWYDALESRPAAVLQAWRERAVRWWGTRVQVQTAQGVLQGVLRDVDAGGGLVLELDDGDRRALLSGEVTQVRPVPGDA